MPSVDNNAVAKLGHVDRGNTGPGLSVPRRMPSGGPNSGFGPARPQMYSKAVPDRPR